jgi:hypothetical protein
MRAPEHPEPLVAMLCTETFEDIATGPPRLWGQRLKRRARAKTPSRHRPGDGVLTSSRWSKQYVGRQRPECKFASAFTSTIAVAVVAALPMALVIIWVCS